MLTVVLLEEKGWLVDGYLTLCLQMTAVYRIHRLDILWLRLGLRYLSASVGLMVLVLLGCWSIQP
jgi:hypothetical protein